MSRAKGAAGRSAVAILGLLGKNRHERTGYELYGAAVAAARDPVFYTRLGVPDTLDGRFDLVGLHVSLLIRHLRRRAAPGPALSQAVFDAMFNDMDVNLREMGVGDLSVGKRVRAMWEAFHGRAAAYEAALDDPNEAALPKALARNVWRGGGADGADALAHVARAQDAALASQTIEDFAAGRAVYRPVADLLA
jgi:cytochrome b pre-mRNA-processing protein 3